MLAVAVGAADVGAAVRDAVGLATPVGVPVADGGAIPVGSEDGLTVAAGEGVVVLVPSDAHARESLTPGADAQTERAGVTQELPSAAVRESDTRMNG